MFCTRLSPACFLCLWSVLVSVPVLVGAGHAAETGRGAGGVTDLTAHAVVVHNYVDSYVRRDGDPYVFGGQSALTLPEKGWGKAVGKYADDNRVELWFPYAEPVTLSRLRFRMGVHRPVRHRVQAWDGDRWRTIVRVDESNPVGTDIRFEPVTTRGIRLLIDKTSYIGFDIHRIGQVAVYGRGGPQAETPDVGWSFESGRELNVFELGEQVSVDCRIDAPPGGTVTWEWVDWYLRPVAAGGSRGFDGSKQVFRWRPTEQGPYFLRTTLRRHGAVASQALFLIGVRDPDVAEGLEVEEYLPKKGGRVRDERDLVGPGRMLFSSEIYHHMSRPHYLPAEQWFQQFDKSDVDMVGALVNFGALMPLPGVYNFDCLDHVVDMAERHDLRLETGFWRYWFSGPDRPHWWLEEELIRDHSGKPGSGFNHAFSYWGPRYREHVRDAVRLIVKRYRDHPAVAVWNFQPFGHVDWGWMGRLDISFDYSEFSRRAFHRFLREQRGLNLQQVSHRYGEKFDSWDDVELPVPGWMSFWKDRRSDHYLDDRAVWLDFVDYRHWSCAESARMIYDAIRAIDPVRSFGAWMGIMAGKGEEWNRLCAAYGVPGGSNGAQWTEYTRMSLVQRRAGRVSRQEHGGQIDARREDPVWEMHNMIFNNNLFKTKYFNFVFPVFQDNPAWWDVFANPRCRQILTDMADAEIPRSQVGALHSYDTNWFEGRNSYSFIELDRWWRMLAWGRSMTDNRWVEWYSNGGDLTGINDLEVIIDNHSRVMRPNAEDALYDYVLGGGRLVLWANSGQLTYGSTESQWNLLRRLGYENVDGLSETFRRGVLKPIQGNGVLISFEELPVGDWSPLHKREAKVLATIDGKPGAITWPVGEGRVLLITGEEGAPNLFDLIEVEVNDRKRYWPERSARRRKFVETVRPLYRDLVLFGGDLGEPVAEITGDIRWYHKRKGTDFHVLCLLNETDAPVSDLTARLRLAPGTYSVQWWSLDGYESLPDRTAGELVKPFALPEVPSKRMRILRVDRVR
jgi:hypothetical protein